LLPLSTFAVIEKSSEYKYWGLDIKYPQIPIATDLLPGCAENLTLGNKICPSMNKGATKNVLLIGDSHAGHISLALNSAAKIENWNSIFYRTKIENLDLSANGKFDKWILQNKPDLIIVSEYWQLNNQKVKIKNKLLNLKNFAPNILFIENNPVWPDGDRFRLAGYVIAPNTMQKSFPKAEMQIEDIGVSDELAKFSKANGISIMNFNSLFCSSTVCTRYQDGGWLYIDSNHFSIAGAALTIPALSNFLRILI
jgi:hypothetical protein